VAASAAAAPLRAADSTCGKSVEESHRKYWLSVLRRVANPVLTNLAQNKLRERMPVEVPGGKVEHRRQFAHLEAFGRTLAGIAPWLGLQEKPADEIELGKRYLQLAREALVNATNPQAADFMNFIKGSQPVGGRCISRSECCQRAASIEAFGETECAWQRPY
jgi:hypothetical protein